MIRIIYVIIAIALKDLKLPYRNLNLLVEKSAIRFEPYTQKNGKVEYLFYVIFLFFYTTLIMIII